MKKPDMISIRIPSDLLRQIDTIKEREGIDRTALIIRALRYWVAVDGNVTTDNEYLNRLEKLEKNMAVIADGIESVKELRERAAEQEKVIRVLMQMIQ
jgi:metal-responsive CopG/Arc/MetJ family transcriptional regulator